MTARNSYASKQTGLTFIEIFVVIIIIGILTGISVPSLRKTFNNLQLTSFSRELQSYMNFLRERSIVEGKVVYFNIDNDKKEYSAQIKGGETKLKTYFIPNDIDIEITKKDITDIPQISFSPDGQIEKVTLKITNPDNQSIVLTTEGVFGKVKVQSQEQ